MVYAIGALRFYITVQLKNNISKNNFASHYCGSSFLSFQLQEMYKTWNLCKSAKNFVLYPLSVDVLFLKQRFRFCGRAL